MGCSQWLLALIPPVYVILEKKIQQCEACSPVCFHLECVINQRFMDNPVFTAKIPSVSTVEEATFEITLIYLPLYE